MSTPYDTVVYPSLCHPQTHPDRLAVIANLFGLDPAAPDRCRVLEIGCGDAANLLPLATAFPNSNFFGFDLAETRINAGRQAAADLGLSNLELIQQDILKFPLEGEPFDYIVAHGVYSWIPREARERLLAICRARLAPQGIAYISYNALPGCHLRRIAWDIMRFHTRAVEDPAERARQAVAVCQLIANSVDRPGAYASLFKEQLEQIQRYRAGHLFHDDLAEVNEPLYFHEFAEQAAEHQLQYVGEADFFEMLDDIFTPEARRIFAMMEDSRLTREQYLDFVKCRRFRQTLICRSEAPLRYPAESAAIGRFYISSPAQAEVVGANPDGTPIERFSHARGGALQVGHPLGIRVLHHLARCSPETVSFADLFEAAAAGWSEDRDKARQALQDILLEAYRAGVVEFRRTPLPCVGRPSERPTVSRFARWQLGRAQTVTTLRGENLRIEDESGKRLFLLLDGTRTFGDLEQALAAEHGSNNGNGNVNGQLHKRIEELARLALLEA